MKDPLVIGILFLFFGLLIGGLSAWLITKYRLRSQAVFPDVLTSDYVLKAVHEQLQQQADTMRTDLEEKEEEIRTLSRFLSAKEQIILNLDDRLRTQREELDALQQRSRAEFENLANRILEEKTRTFTRQNHQQLEGLLSPLREKIKAFESGIEQRFLEETRDRVSLKKEIENLRELNSQLSQEANNLVSALKGDNKAQGDWGELQLETLLQKAGLVKDIHYEVQRSYRDEEGQLKRPDFIINLPEGKHLIIDSKVSLVAYERYFNAEDAATQAQHAKTHIDSIRQHVRELSRKNYQQLYQIQSPDYLLLFIPLEPAFALATREDPRLFLDALDQHIVIVTTSTLLATMRTVSYIWKQEKQKKSVLEIARQSGMLYDKFCAFVEDLQAIGQRLDSAQLIYQDAMKKLATSKKQGDTLIGRAERIKELGARASKTLPKAWLDEVHEEQNNGPPSKKTK